MHSNNKIWLGIEIGGTKLQIAISDSEGSLQQLLRYTVDATAGAAGIRAQIQKSISEIGINTIAAIGVGFGGPVNWQTGIVQTSHQVAGWSDFHLKDWLQQLTGAPVAVDNDANVAALAEALYGAGCGCNPVFYMTIGSGIGGGVVMNEKIYHGALPGEVEIGHVRLTKSGTTLESQCSGWAVNKKIRSYVTENPNSFLAQQAAKQHGPEALLLKPALEHGDSAAQQLIASIADDLAFGLSHVVHLFHPQIIIIGGGLSLLGEPLRAAITGQLHQYTMAAFLPAPKIAIATLGENVVPVGALALAKNIYYEIQNKDT